MSDRVTARALRVWQIFNFCFTLIADNKTSREIAGELFVSIRTIENHRANICTKLDLRGAHVLLKFALEHKPAL